MPRLWGHDHKGTKRVLRGGSWNNNARNTRSAYRNNAHPDNRDNNIGLRLARAQPGAGEPLLTRSRSRPRASGSWRKAKGPGSVSSGQQPFGESSPRARSFSETL